MKSGLVKAGAVIAGLLMLGFVMAAFSPSWTVDDIQHSGKALVVTCHEKWHTDHLRKVTVTAAASNGLKDGDACPS